MKRLKYLLLHMDQMTSTYRDMYEGPIVYFRVYRRDECRAGKREASGQV